MSDLLIVTPEEAEACKIALQCIKNLEVDLFKGKYDAVNGSSQYMYGIGAVLDLLEAFAGLDSSFYTDEFFENMAKSEARAEKHKREMAGE